VDITQYQWLSPAWRPRRPGSRAETADILLVFGSTDLLQRSDLLSELASAFPGARRIGCSTAGEILGTSVADDSLVATAIRFDDTRVVAAETAIDGDGDSTDAGRRLALLLLNDELVHVLVLSDGLHANGSALVRGLTSVLPDGVQVTGGLAGDGERFERTLVFLDDAPATRRVAAVGLYGSRLRVGYGSLGGWDPFGPERLITLASGNVLRELDGRSALGLYKKFLGEYAADLPASALLFPLVLRSPDGGPGVVRTVQSIDEASGAMTFAGDVPEGHYARLMKANFERLIDGAIGAARTSAEPLGGCHPELALLISCVGRRKVLRQRIEEEVESVSEVFGPATALAGFYSYGEISPFSPGARCELHNQTMTITTLREV